VSASADLAPADRRLYAIRDVTATVESLPLITASILSKKLAAGLQGLVLDVKTGSGAVMSGLDDARALAQSLVEVACAAGLPAVALLTDMDSVLGTTAGNALEVQEALDFLAGKRGAGGVGGMDDFVRSTVTGLDTGTPANGRDPRLLDLTLVLAGECLALAGLAADAAAGRLRAAQALQDGSAAESFARMVAGLGGPADVLQQAGLPRAPVQREVLAPHSGWLTGMDTRALGMAVVALGGGRQRPGDAVDPRVGLSHMAQVGQALAIGQPLARVHAAEAASAEAAVQAVLAACRIGEAAVHTAPMVQERVTGTT